MNFNDIKNITIGNTQIKKVTLGDKVLWNNNITYSFVKDLVTYSDNNNYLLPNKSNYAGVAVEIDKYIEGDLDSSSFIFPVLTSNSDLVVILGNDVYWNKDLYGAKERPATKVTVSYNMSDYGNITGSKDISLGANKIEVSEYSISSLTVNKSTTPILSPNKSEYDIGIIGYSRETYTSGADIEIDDVSTIGERGKIRVYIDDNSDWCSVTEDKKITVIKNPSQEERTCKLSAYFWNHEDTKRSITIRQKGQSFSVVVKPTTTIEVSTSATYNPGSGIITYFDASITCKLNGEPYNPPVDSVSIGYFMSAGEGALIKEVKSSGFANGVCMLRVYYNTVENALDGYYRKGGVQISIENPIDGALPVIKTITVEQRK